MKGIGPVHFAMMAGFVVGIIIAAGQSTQGLGIVQILGLVSFVVGFLGMFGKLPIKGVPGGLLTGFGLGTYAGAFLG